MKKVNIKRAAAALCSVIMMISAASCGSTDSSKADKKSSSKAAAASKTNNEPTVTEALRDMEQEKGLVQEIEAYEDVDDGAFYMTNDATTTASNTAIPKAGADNTEEYAHVEENGFIDTADQPISTFSTDIDTASYTNARRMINNGYMVYADAVRTEEFINYFKYDYQMPNGEAVSINTELSDCPWNPEAKLMLVGIQAMEAPVQDIDSNIVFLIDVSGSMEDENKLPLVREAFAMLADNLGANDRVSIVTYAGEDRIALEGAKGSDKGSIISTLNSLTAGGSTAGAAGINSAYALAEKYFIKGGNNRVILATDGDLNVGASSAEELTALIEEKRDSGIALSVLGFGEGNFKDARLEALADNGNGNYAYIDTIDEAKRVLVTEMNGTMFTVAKDTKVQIEFDDSKVRSYRLVGYENRLLNTEDFEDDTKDAGDIGSGQQVTALYELILNDAPENDMLKVSVRYKEADEDVSKLIEKEVKNEEYVELSKISDNMKGAVAAAMFAKAIRSESKENNENEPLGKEELFSYIDASPLPSAFSELSELIEKYRAL